MRKIYTSLILIIFYLVPVISHGQTCALTATFTTFESRCAATGAIQVFATGGSGAYRYKVTGPVNTNFTTSDSITGLSSGSYTVIVNDLVSNCTFTKAGVIVPGTYQAPNFTLIGTDVSCNNANNGSIKLDSLQYGRSPFTFQIVAPSPTGVGQTNTTGSFNNLIAGTYSIQLSDSCGGLQTRQVIINNYTWTLNSASFQKIACDTASGSITVTDSRGNISTVSGISGFSYGVVRSPGDTVWSSSPNITFPMNGNGSFKVVARDACGIIKSLSTSVFLFPSVAASIKIYNQACATFSAAVDSIKNFYNANFCLYDSAGNQLSCNSSGVFNNLAYGSYCIKAYDSCTDTTITRCFSVAQPLPSVSDTVLISNKTCQSFSASIVGQRNLTNPQYCLYDSSGTLLKCNNTGRLDSLSYGNYCIKTHDGCIDTTITRCFVAYPPMPKLDSIATNYLDCNNISIHVYGDSLTHPNYCLYDSLGNLLRCDTTGIFDSLTVGYYCVHIHDVCRDTTLIQCFPVGPPAITNDLSVSFSNKTCSTFTAKVTSHNLIHPYYCLYDTSNVQIACDSTGIFNNLKYGSYCVHAANSCPDTTLTYCFTQSAPLPYVDANVNISNRTCAGFTAKITGQTNLTNPQYCLYDTSGVQLSCNTNGIFNNLHYGSYCIKIVNSCYDTTITRCFTTSFMPISISVTASKSCLIGYTKFSVSITGGGAPYDVKIYNPDNSLFSDSTYNNTNFSIGNIPPLSGGQKYKVVVSDNCGDKDSTTVATTPSYFNHTPTLNRKCPSGKWASGSGDIKINASTNLGTFTVNVISKNFVALSPSLTPDNVVDSFYSFLDLGPGTYIVSYRLSNSCRVTIYDTITVPVYQFPDLTRSSAYQCDVSGFSIGAVVSNGEGPFTYEIIGSTPATPSILAGPQLNPLFNINNGHSYSLVRLRAIDACGNAALNDISILPLSINGIVASENCLLQPTTLSADSTINATYAWYRKTSINATDSTLIGTSSSYYVPSVLPADTGIYVCHMEVNAGCLRRNFIYDLTGQCYIVLPVSLLDVTGKLQQNNVLLDWKVPGMSDVKKYIIERKDASGNFVEIGELPQKPGGSQLQRYTFTDKYPEHGDNFYRIRIVKNDGKTEYSKIILVSFGNTSLNILIYPNPATNTLHINFSQSNNHRYKVSLYNSVHQLMSESLFVAGVNNNMQITRTKTMSTGIYLLRISDENTGEQFTQKIIFR